MANPVGHWFQLADEDKDGAIAGAEAVRFFTKSGLPQDVLGQIWELSSGGGPKLNVAQFTTALRLVSLAQTTGGRLIPDQARVVAMGGGPQLPTPRLAGLTDAAPTPSIQTYNPQITGLQPQMTGGLQPQLTVGLTPQMTGGLQPPVPAAAGRTGYTPQPTGALTPQPQPPAAAAGGFTGGPRPPPAAAYHSGVGSSSGGPGSSGGYAPQSTGGYTPQATGGYVPQATGGYGGAAAAAAGGGGGGGGGLPGFPPVTPADLQRYQATFLATDADRDGIVKGGECFPVFMQSGLDKALLKRMWDLVAGSTGHLTAEQFFKCMYLMDGMRRGAPLPPLLPPGQWPQVGPLPGAVTGQQQQQQHYALAAAGLAGGGGVSSSGGALPADNWSLDSQFGHKGAVKAITDAYDQTLPRIPDPPGKFKYEAAAAAAAGPSAVPDLDTAVASMLAPADKARWEAEQQEAARKEQQQREAEAEAAAAKARIEAFQVALTELVIFKSKTDVALLQASDAAARLKAEAEDTELRYNRAHLAAQSQAEAGSKARQELQALLARKQEAANKLELLQEELKLMHNLNPAEMVALEKEVGGLVAQVAAAESRKAALEIQLDSGRKQKELLSGRISDLELAAAAGEGEVKRAREELAELQSKVSTAEGVALAPDALGQVGPLLGTAASAYRRLYSSALAAGLEVPYEANLNNVGALVWLEQLLSGTADWVDDDQAVSGYTVVNALPDLEGVPPPLLRAAALAAAAQPPIRPAALQPRALEVTAVAAPAAASGKGEAVALQPTDAAGSAGPGAAATPAPAEAAGGGRGAVAAVAASVAAAAAGGDAVAAAAAADSGGELADAGSPAITAASPGDESSLPAAPSAPVLPAAGDSLAFEDDAAFGGSSASAAEHDAASSLAAEAVGAAPHAAAAAGSSFNLPASDAAAAEAPLQPPPAAAAAVPAAAAAAAVPAIVPTPALTVLPAGHRKSVADEDDSDVLSSGLLSPAALSGVHPPPPALADLSGFDPAAYRLPDTTTARALGQQYSLDSSFGGSFTAGGASSAGVTGASGFDDDAFGAGSSHTGASAAAVGGTGGLGSAAASADGAAGTAGAAAGFEDNAF